MDRQGATLSFWFGDLSADDAVPPERSRLWFGGLKETDELLRTEFSEDVSRAAGGEYDTWTATPRGTLALILLLDQFPRNIFRKTARAFATDKQALAICLAGIESEFDRQLAIFERAFFYLPMEHSEDLEMQKLSVAAFENLVTESSPAQRSMAESYHDYAVRHHVIIERFGRFPHRNDILGRVSTVEEIEFLKQPGSSF